MVTSCDVSDILSREAMESGLIQVGKYTGEIDNSSSPKTAFQVDMMSMASLSTTFPQLTIYQNYLPP